MSFLFPRTISVSRQPPESGFGALPPSGMHPNTETVVLSDLPASIQQSSTAGKPEANVPADRNSASAWRIFIPLYSAPTPDLIKTNDIIVDDLGSRYQVIAPYWNSLGFNLLAERLEA